ncbi:MAG: type II toxin-antitoxin system prevent-host-death family antitoxin [Chloroflexi bacterium]|nr:type II toxin-antitoxin system prevent-host-death family antitoxin [Chloroflexota bacterium]
MPNIGVRELKQHASEILRRVRAGEAVTITHRGLAVARIVPVLDETHQREAAAAVWAEMDALTREIGTRWPVGVSAADAVREQRRDL